MAKRPVKNQSQQEQTPAELIAILLGQMKLEETINRTQSMRAQGQLYAGGRLLVPDWGAHANN